MKRIFAKWKWLQILEGIVLLLIGVAIATLVWFTGEGQGEPNTSRAIQSSLGYIVAGGVALNGVIAVVFNLVGKPLKLEASFIVGLLLVALGILITILVVDNPSIIANVILITAGVFLIGFAIYLIVYGIRRLQDKDKSKFMPILGFIGAGLLAGAGVVIFIFLQEQIAQQIAITVVGALIAVAGLYALISLLVTTMRLNKAKRLMEEAYGREAPKKGKVEEKEPVKIEESKQILEHHEDASNDDEGKEVEKKDEDDVIDAEIVE